MSAKLRILSYKTKVRTSIKDTLKVAVALCIVVSCLSLPAGSANAIPTAEDINSLSETVKLTVDTFMQESRPLRLRFEFSGRFLNPDDKDNLHELAKKARDRLQAITRNQQALKNEIEDYQGDDWDAKYGANGLWRKLFADLYTTTLNKCQIDFYLALSSQQRQRNKILHKILAQIDSLDTTYRSANSQLLRASTIALLSRTDPAYKSLAMEQLDLLITQTDIPDAIYFRAVIEKIKLVGQTGPGQLDILTEELVRSDCAGDLELILPLAFLQQRYEPTGFEKTVSLFPQTEDLLGSLILSDLSGRIAQQQSLQRISVFEAELAVQAAWKNETEDYKMLLDYLSGTGKFQTPLILYVTAAAFADSSPTKAVNLLVKASNLQQSKKNNRLDIKAEKIAAQAAQLAYNLFAEDSNNCRLTLTAFENCRTIANGKIDVELEYLYSIVLNNCGLAEEGGKLLQKIVDRPAKNQRIRAEAISTYCRLLLESKDESSLQKVLNILTEAETARDPNLNVLKSRALRRLDRLDESANCLLAAIESSRCELAGEAMELLSEIIDEIEQVQTDEFTKMVQDCEKLAKICYDCLDGTQKRRAGLILAEIAVLAADKDKEKLSMVDKLLDNLAGNNTSNNASDNVDLLRCRARLLGKQRKFSEAAGLWAQICRIRKNQSPSTSRRSWKWWRAKFYQLYCWAKISQVEKQNVLHTIEVLENSFSDIPPLWAEKLNLLKQQCLSQLIDAGK